MKPEIPILVTLFACIAFSIKVVVEARMRSKLLAAGRPDELIQTILVSEERQRRHSSLRLGLVLVCVALGFALIEALGWRQVTPGVVAVLLGATGAGNIVAYVVTRKLESP